MELAESTWPDVADTAAEFALLPVGSTEQHGPHAPLGTDSFAAAAIARAAAESADLEVLVAPTIPIGVSEEHRHFAGTMWVTPDTFRSYVRETVESLLAGKVRVVVIVNGHGGNVPALREVAARLTRRLDEGVVTAFTWFDAVESDDLGHAGPVETSLLLELHPELVATDRLERVADGAADRWGEFHAGAEVAYDAAEFAPNGAVGDPTEASAERGAAILASARDALGGLLEVLHHRDSDALVGPEWER